MKMIPLLLSCSILFLSVTTPISAGLPPTIDFSLNGDGFKWEKAYEGNLDHLSIVQYVPQGENLQNWTKLVNVMSYQGFDADPKKMFSLMTEELKARLPNNKVEYKILENTPDSIIAEWWINDKSPSDEHSWIKIIKDKEAVVSLLYTTKKLDEVEAVRPAWEKALRNAKIKS